MQIQGKKKEDTDALQIWNMTVWKGHIANTAAAPSIPMLMRCSDFLNSIWTGFVFFVMYLSIL